MTWIDAPRDRPVDKGRRWPGAESGRGGGEMETMRAAVVKNCDSVVVMVWFLSVVGGLSPAR